MPPPVFELEHTSTIPYVLFRNTDILFQQLDACSSDTDSLAVGHVSLNDFRAIEAERDRRGRRYRFFFHPNTGSLIVRIPTGRHEQGHGAVYELVHDAIKDMGLGKQWKSRFATKYRGPADEANEGDACGGPRWRTHRHNGQIWPTLVVESGATQSMPSLRMKAQWWFAASNNHMKVVVLVNLVPATSTINIEQWVVGESGQPAIRQQVSIYWAGPSSFIQTPSDHRTSKDFHVNGAPSFYDLTI